MKKKKLKNESRISQVLVSDITGTKCAEDLFLGTAFVGTGCSCLIDASDQLPHICQLLLTHQTQLLTFNKSHVLSPLLLWTCPDLYSQYATSSLIIVGYWFFGRATTSVPQGERSASGALHEGLSLMLFVHLMISTMNVTSSVFRLSGSLCCWWMVARRQE